MSLLIKDTQCAIFMEEEVEIAQLRIIGIEG